MYNKISRHVYQRYLDRGLKIEKIYKDLSIKNLNTLVTTPDGTKVLFTKNKLKFIIKKDVVVTVMKIRPREIKKELRKYNFYKNNNTKIN